MPIVYVANTTVEAATRNIFEPAAKEMTGPHLRLPAKPDLFIGTAGSFKSTVTSPTCRSLYTTGLANCLAVALLYRPEGKVTHFCLCHIGDYRHLRLGTEPPPKRSGFSLGSARQAQATTQTPPEPEKQGPSMGDRLDEFVRGYMSKEADRWAVVASTSGRAPAIDGAVEELGRWVKNADQIWTYRNEKLTTMDFGIDIEGNVGESWPTG